MKRIIFHIDVNSAFLSWEAVYRIQHLGCSTDLRREVAAVGGDAALRHGIILAKSIPAKKYQIRTGESIPEALQKCPDLKLVPPDYGLYENCSAAFIHILRRYSPCVEQYSIDEAFVDMTGTEALWGTPAEAADRIRCQIREELGFTVNVGISENKLLAKMASDFQKPDRTHTLWRSEIAAKMWPLPVSDLFFVGRATTQKLYKLGIHTIGELAGCDPAILKSHLKKHGELIYAFANGVDLSAVLSQPPQNKGYGNSTTIPFDVTDSATARLVLLALCETVGARLRADSVCAGVIAVGIKTFDFRYASRQMTLQNPTDVTAELHRCACALFDSLWDKTPIRHLGIHTSRISDRGQARQLALFDELDRFPSINAAPIRGRSDNPAEPLGLTKYEKLLRMDAAVDRIRKRYGIDAIKRAAFLENPIDHMSGGISREKRTSDHA